MGFFLAQIGIVCSSFGWVFGYGVIVDGKEGMLSFRSVFAQDRSCWVSKGDGTARVTYFFRSQYKGKFCTGHMYTVQRRIYFSPEKGEKTSVPIASHFLSWGRRRIRREMLLLPFDEWKREKILNISFSRAVTIHHTPFLPRNFLCQITAILPGFLSFSFFSR